MRTALRDLRLEALCVVYPGTRRHSLARRARKLLICTPAEICQH
jgi:hypothetical protein